MTGGQAEGRFDVAIVGGGLAGGLFCLALARHRPELKIALVERGDRLAGNHTWCFHHTDLDAAGHELLRPCVHACWPRHEVRFDRFRRVLEQPYYAVLSDGLATQVAASLERPGCRLLLGQTVRDAAADGVTLDDGTKLSADFVLDARGRAGDSTRGGRCGFQKFVGLEVECSEPHPWPHPVLMDATVPQLDGFRFLYVLPFDTHRVLLEDTYFSGSPDLDLAGVHDRVLEYAAAAGASVRRIVRQEQGVLPMPWRADMQASPLARCDARSGTVSPLVAGYAGGWFHPGTGYSLGFAACLAEGLARGPLPPPRATVEGLWRRHRSQARYAERLNGMLFRGTRPERRHELFARFYHYPESTIGRFYALRMTPWDRLRLLIGRPPVALSLRRLPAGLRASLGG